MTKATRWARAWGLEAEGGLRRGGKPARHLLSRDPLLRVSLPPPLAGVKPAGASLSTQLQARSYPTKVECRRTPPSVRRRSSPKFRRGVSAGRRVTLPEA